jgi:preprotein translocase subunit SecF
MAFWIIMKPIYTILFSISILFFVASIIALALYGLNFGVDFKGGSVMELEFQQRPEIEEIRSFLTEQPVLKDREVTVNPSGDKAVIIRTVDLGEDQHQALLAALKSKFSSAGLQENRFESVGPTIGRELRNKSLVAILIVLAAIISYIAITFRKLSRTLSLLAMNAATVIGLLHDIVIPLGVFAVLGHYAGVQISAVFVAAILTILGYTVSDKVVIFDRVRENILRGRVGDLGAIVHASVMQTLVRSINNTLTVVLSSAAIYLYGGESIKYFALALMIGILLGALSSITVAAPLLVWLSRWGSRRNLT